LRNAHKLLTNEIEDSAIESEDVLIYIILKVLGAETSLVGAEYHTLYQRGNQMKSRQHAVFIVRLVLEYFMVVKRAICLPFSQQVYNANIQNPIDFRICINE
jgi:hypothetical protein